MKIVMQFLVQKNIKMEQLLKRITSMETLQLLSLMVKNMLIKIVVMI